jgi:predicted nucleic acid-binding protein
MVVLDTNVIIDHLKQPSGANTLLMQVNQKEGKDSLAISTITLQELYEGKSTKNAIKLRAMLSVLGPLKILDYNIKIAETAGELARDIDRPIEFPDAAIAGTCIFHKFQFLTLNSKHFVGIPDLQLYSNA